MDVEIELPKDLEQRIETLASARGMTASALLIEWIEEDLARKEADTVGASAPKPAGC